MTDLPIKNSPNTPILTSDAPKAIGPYSPGMMTHGCGRTIYVSGQIALDPNGFGKLIGTTIEEQTEQAIKNLEFILKAAKANLENVVNVTIYLTDFENFTAMNKVYMSRFNEPRPARATVGVKELPQKALVEIAAIAFIPQATWLDRILHFIRGKHS